MKFHLTLPLVAMVFLSVACTTQPIVSQPKKLYTSQEYGNLTFCVGLSDTARAAAERKLAGVSQEEVKKYYSGKAHPELTTAIVQRVYADKFTGVWDYTISFFQECAQNIAGVPKERVRMAAFCRQNSLIADIAYGYKAEGASRETAYGHFAGFKSKTPAKIIDQVYDGKKSRAETSLEIWNACMSPISESR